MVALAASVVPTFLARRSTGSGWRLIEAQFLQPLDIAADRHGLHAHAFDDHALPGALIGRQCRSASRASPVVICKPMPAMRRSKLLRISRDVSFRRKPSESGSVLRDHDNRHRFIIRLPYYIPADRPNPAAARRRRVPAPPHFWNIDEFPTVEAGQAELIPRLKPPGQVERRRRPPTRRNLPQVLRTSATLVNRSARASTFCAAGRRSAS